MIQQIFPNFQIKITRSRITSFAGLSLIAHLANSLGIIKWIDEHLHFLKQRNRGYSVWESILSLILLLIAGGETLDEMKVLQADHGLKKLLAKPSLPAPTTMGEFLHKFNRKALKGIAIVNANLVRKVLSLKKLNTLTLDFDSTLIEAGKKEAMTTYEGFDGYNPLLCFISELKLVLRGLFRPGNASPAAHALSFLRGSLKLLPPRITTIMIRSDSAWYNYKVMDFCHDRGILFSITADMHSSLRQALEIIPEEEWLPFDETHEIAETVHVVNKSLRAYRVVALRKEAPQPDLFEGPYHYKAVITNRDDLQAKELIHWHRKRADSENIIKEQKHGFALKRLPCGTLLANAAFFQISILSYNLTQAFKLLLLPKGWHSFTVKTLRFRLLNMGAVVAKHARKLILKLPSNHPHRETLSNCRYRIIGIAAECC